MATFEILSFLRGTSDRYPTDKLYIGEPRKDRKPRDTVQEIHEAADNWFDAQFGCRFRSQALFVSPQLLVASGYAATPEHVVRVIPLGKYQYCWSRKTSDLLSLLKSVFCAEDVAQVLGAAEYTNSDLGGAHASGHELMLYCERYIAIPLSLLGDDILTPVAPASSIILSAWG